MPTSIPASTLTPESSPDSSSSINTNTIGASVGATLAALLVVGAAFYLWKRRVKSVSHDHKVDTSEEELHSLRPQDAKAFDTGHHVVYEVPGWQILDAQELPGRPI